MSLTNLVAKLLIENYFPIGAWDVADDLNSYCCSHTESTEDTLLLCMRPLSLTHVVNRIAECWDLKLKVKMVMVTQLLAMV